MYETILYLGKGDLVGCDMNKHLSAQSTSVVVPGVAAGKNERRTSIGLGIPEVVVKSNADVRALTYCDLKVIWISKLLLPFRTIKWLNIAIYFSNIKYWYFSVFEYTRVS